MKIALGTVQFGLDYGIANQGGKIASDVASKMLALASKEGIRLLDTAISYGDSEANLGTLGIKGFDVVTKLPSVPNSCDDISTWIEKEVLNSIERLGVNSLYGLLLHRPEQLLNSKSDAIYKSLSDLRNRELVSKIGISIYSPIDFDIISKKYNLDLIQAPLNLIDQRFVKSGCFSRMKEAGIEVHTRSTFLQGLLLMPYSSIPEKFLKWKNLWIAWHQWLSENSISAIQGCLAYSLSIPEVDRVVIGADSEIHLKEIIDLSRKPNRDIFPEISSNDLELINPSHWSSL